MWNFEEDLAARNRLVANIVTLLANGQFDELERLSNGNRLSSSEMRIKITSYGCHFLPFPDGNFKKIDYIAIVGSTPMRWSVVVPLFTEEEGPSDLSVELTLVELGEYCYAIEIDNIHVR